MKAAVFKEKNLLVVEEVPDPKPKDDEVVMKVSYCAICGSDLHRYHYGMMPPGTIMGHEYSGIIVDKGAEVGEFKIGDRVVRSGGKSNPWKDVPWYPQRFSARDDPYERAQHNSNTYDDWFLERPYFIFGASDVALRFLLTLREYPPSQTPGSFNLDSIRKQIESTVRAER